MFYECLFEDGQNQSVVTLGLGSDTKQLCMHSGRLMVAKESV